VLFPRALQETNVQSVPVLEIYSRIVGKIANWKNYFYSETAVVQTQTWWRRTFANKRNVRAAGESLTTGYSYSAVRL